MTYAGDLLSPGEVCRVVQSVVSRRLEYRFCVARGNVVALKLPVADKVSCASNDESFFDTKTKVSQLLVDDGRGCATEQTSEVPL